MVSAMTKKTVAEWRALIGALPQPDGVSHYKVIAEHILVELKGYSWDTKPEPWRRDVAALAGILEALVQMELAAVTTEGSR